jgi:hypothetical protein
LPCLEDITHLRQKRISRERSSAKSPALALPYRMRTQLLYVHCRERIVAIKTFLSCLLSVSIQNQFIQYFSQHGIALPISPSMVAPGFPVVTQACRAGFIDPDLFRGACRPRSVRLPSPRCNAVDLDEYSFSCRREDVCF